MVVTINDVAKKAKVAKSTVSKVLKNYSNVSKETKEKVLQAVEELGYVPNTMASALSSKTYDKVALYIYINDKGQAIDEINMRYIQGAFHAAKELDLHITTIFHESVSDLTADALISNFKSQGISGIVVFGLNKEDTIIHNIIERKVFKIVVVDAPIVNEYTSSVSINHELGQYEVAKAVIEPEYCKKVLYLAGKKNGYVTDERLKGIERLSHEYGFSLQVEYAEFSEKKAYEITMRQATYVDTVVCASDLMAIGAINALIKMNIFRRCTGFDGIALLGYAGKNIMTCQQNFYQIATTAIHEIKQLMNNQKGRSILLDHKIISIQYEDVIF